MITCAKRIKFGILFISCISFIIFLKKLNNNENLTLPRFIFHNNFLNNTRGNRPAFTNNEPPPKSDENTQGLGENGIPVKIDQANLNEEELLEYNKRNEHVDLNVFVSDRISVRRYLSDNRFDECKVPKQYTNLPKTSVIIIFHNEIYSMLLRTIHSVLDRSDPNLLEEIILVDDASTFDYIEGKLQNYLTHLPKVHLVRKTERQGIAKARMAGIEVAKGETLTFLDSHMEVLPGWLEPLLEQIQRDPNSIAEPVHVAIDAENFSMSLDSFSKTFVGGFTWRLDFVWKLVDKKFQNRPGVPYSPNPDPAIVGGMFTIGTAFFKQLGLYDVTSGLYGTEQIELSFKTWLCHGSIYKIPCSWIGHAFHNRMDEPYKQMNSEWMKKAKDRIAVVWMDEYRQFYEENFVKIFDDLGDISKQIEFRKNNKCRSFKWYLENIYPDKLDPFTAIRRGQVRNEKTNNCLEDDNKYTKCKKVHLNTNNNVEIGSTIWYLSKEGVMQNEHICLNVNVKPGIITSVNCLQDSKPDYFTYHETNRTIETSQGCFELNKESESVILRPCQIDNPYQKWTWNIL